MSSTEKEPASRYESEFVELKKLGRGGYGTVMMVKNKLDGKEYAMKRIRFHYHHGALKSRLAREVQALASLNHPNIVRYHVAWIERSNIPVAAPKRGARRGAAEEEDDAGEDEDDDEGSSAPSDDDEDEDEDGEDGDGSEDGEGSRAAEETSETSHTRDGLSPSTSPSLTGKRGDDDSEGSDDDDDGEDGGEAEEEESVGQQLPFEWDEPSPAKPLAKKTARAGERKQQRKKARAERKRRDEKKKGDEETWSQGTLYIQMQLYEDTLQHWLQDDHRAFSRRESLSIFRQVALALEYIHSQGIIHRDLKPANIFLTHEPDGRCAVCVGDFGLAAFTSSRVALSASSGSSGDAVSPIKPRDAAAEPQQQQRQPWGSMPIATAAAAAAAAEVSSSLVLVASPPSPMMAAAAAAAASSSAALSRSFNAGPAGPVGIGAWGSGAGASCAASYGGFGSGAGQCGRDRSSTVSCAAAAMMAAAEAHTAGVGTSTYASPEQRGGDACYDEKTDIYSLGLILLELVHPPFSTMMERYTVMSAARRGELPKALVSQFPEECEVIRRCLARDPRERPSASQLLELPMLYAAEDLPAPAAGAGLVASVVSVAGITSNPLVASGTFERSLGSPAFGSPTISPFSPVSASSASASSGSGSGSAQSPAPATPTAALLASSALAAALSATTTTPSPKLCAALEGSSLKSSAGPSGCACATGTVLLPRQQLETLMRVLQQQSSQIAFLESRVHELTDALSAVASAPASACPSAPTSSGPNAATDPEAPPPFALVPSSSDSSSSGSGSPKSRSSSSRPRAQSQLPPFAPHVLSAQQQAKRGQQQSISPTQLRALAGQTFQDMMLQHQLEQNKQHQQQPQPQPQPQPQAEPQSQTQWHRAVLPSAQCQAVAAAAAAAAAQPQATVGQSLGKQQHPLQQAQSGSSSSEGESPSSLRRSRMPMLQCLGVSVL